MYTESFVCAGARGPPATHFHVSTYDLWRLERGPLHRMAQLLAKYNLQVET